MTSHPDWKVYNGSLRFESQLALETGMDRNGTVVYRAITCAHIRGSHDKEKKIRAQKNFVQNETACYKLRAGEPLGQNPRKAEQGAHNARSIAEHVGA